MFFPFYLFAGTFSDDSDAEKLVFEQWEPEPSADATDEEYHAWEKRNPVWELQAEVGFYMDSDFVELINEKDYVIRMIERETEKLVFRSKDDSKYSHYITISIDSIHGDFSNKDSEFIREPQSTSSLDYLGKFNTVT